MACPINGGGTSLLESQLGWRLRLWRYSSYAISAILVGVVADLYGFVAAIVTIAVLTALSGLVGALRMRETLTKG